MVLKNFSRTLVLRKVTSSISYHAASHCHVSSGAEKFQYAFLNEFHLLFSFHRLNPLLNFTAREKQRRPYRRFPHSRAPLSRIVSMRGRGLSEHFYENHSSVIFVHKNTERVQCSVFIILITQVRIS